MKVSTQAPQIQNAIRGNTYILNIPVYQSDGNTPFNLTGGTVYFTLNSSSTPTSDGTDASAAIKKQVSSFITPSGGSYPSQAQIVLANTDTSGLSQGVYYYDIQVKDGSGNIISLAANTFSVIDDITTRTT